ncbi:unnamed protein product [Schistosoma curassoni]|uniref:Reverse transcriptase domain-containing protein n=1 Tax=Schistosoma curassoni TaxID=6186 RepID=A0A183JY71_9TREM|nr:unnamed protein product [Schistosoma curassoni]
MQLDDLDFADDMALLSQSQQQMQEKTNSVAAASAAVCLNIHKGKSRILLCNTTCTNPVTIDGEDLLDVKTFTYLGSIIDEQGGSDADMNARIGKARAAYLPLKNICNSKQLSTNTKGTKEAITSTCHEVLGHKKHYHKEWITVDTLDKIEERKNKKAAINTSRTRAEKVKAQAKYTKVNKQVKRSIRTDKRKYVEDIAMTAEKAARERNMRRLYDITKKLSGNRLKPERPVKSKEGEVITNIEEQRNRWVEYFKELLNRPVPLNPPNIEAAPTNLPIDVVPPKIKKISMAIRQIKSGKAAGPDNIPAEALKADVAIWDEGQVLTEWKEGILIKIPKKGDLSNCDNYRGITLLSITGKVFNRVLLNKMKNSVDAQLRDQQAGFRKDRSCTDQIATLWIIVEQSIEWNSSLHINFIDHKEAFDSVNRTTLWKLLRYYGQSSLLTSYFININNNNNNNNNSNNNNNDDNNNVHIPILNYFTIIGIIKENTFMEFVGYN